MEMDNKKKQSSCQKEKTQFNCREKAMTSYKTSDLYLSAFLKSRGVILLNVVRKNSKVIFIFQDKGNIQDSISEYFNNSNVEVLSYKD